MAKLPTVAIIGRPNTGKSTLFNRLIGHRKSIVSDIPGTTRDQVAGRVTGSAIDYLLLDTGGMGGGSLDTDLEDDVAGQSLLALENADAILFTMNSREEITSSDLTIVDTLRKNRRAHVPVLVVPTMCDDPTTIDQILPQYYGLGINAEVIPVSAPHRIGIEELKRAIEIALGKMHFQKSEIRVPESPPSRQADETPRIAIIGRTNVGKSSIVNALMSDTQRKKSGLIVSDIPGTTRDAVDTVIRYHDREFIFVDTAGIKRRKGMENDIERYAYVRSVQALEEADIAVLVLDASQPLTRQDKRIAAMVVLEGKGMIILPNKIDLLSAEEKKARLAEIQSELHFCCFAPVVPSSAKTREGLLTIFDFITSVHESRTRRIATKDLNDWYRDTVQGQPMGELARSKHITQAEDIPPTFVLFMKNPKSVHTSQLRYLERNLRRTFGFDGTPVRWVTKTA